MTPEVGEVIIDPECMTFWQESKTAQISVGVFMTILGLVLSAAMTVITLKVKKLVWQQEKVIPLMLMCMCLTLYWLTFFFLYYNIFMATFMMETACTVPAPKAFAVGETYFAWLPSYFLGVGCILNLSKWCYFLMKIWAFVRIGRSIHDFDVTSSQIGEAPPP
jgi:hypothetical protein